MESKCLQIKFYRKANESMYYFCLPMKKRYISRSASIIEKKRREAKTKAVISKKQQRQQKPHRIPKTTKPTKCWGNPKWIPWSLNIDKEETKL